MIWAVGKATWVGGGVEEVSAQAGMDRDYTVFLHVVDQDGRRWSQHDGLLVRGGHATSDWILGWIARNEYELPLPGDASPGEYDIYVGVYYWETGERLPVWDETGERVVDDTVLLEPVTLTD